MPATYAIIWRLLVHLTFKTYFKTLLIKWSIKVSSSFHSKVKPATAVQAELDLLKYIIAFQMQEKIT